jgi:hypothetical protein
MPDKTSHKRRKKPMSLVVVVVETGEATPLTQAVKAEIIRRTCDLLEERADEIDPPPRVGE